MMNCLRAILFVMSVIKGFVSECFVYLLLALSLWHLTHFSLNALDFKKFYDLLFDDYNTCFGLSLKSSAQTLLRDVLLG